MRPVRFYCESIEPRSILDPAESGHLSRVLRLTAGAAVELFDGKGTLAEGIVEQIGRNQVTVRVTQQTHTPPRGTGRIILAVSYAKGQRFDWLAEKCTELGVDHLAAVQFERTVKLGSDKSLERLSKITLSAAKQCGRIYLPRLSGPAKLKPTVEALCGEYPGGTLIYGSPDGRPLRDGGKGSETVDTIIFIGPEGGFTADELDYFETLHASPVCIHPNVLRVETAAVAFCAILRSSHT